MDYTENELNVKNSQIGNQRMENNASDNRNTEKSRRTYLNFGLDEFQAKDEQKRQRRSPHIG